MTKKIVILPKIRSPLLSLCIIMQIKRHESLFYSLQSIDNKFFNCQY